MQLNSFYSWSHYIGFDKVLVKNHRKKKVFANCYRSLLNFFHTQRHLPVGTNSGTNKCREPALGLSWVVRMTVAERLERYCWWLCLFSVETSFPIMVPASQLCSVLSVGYQYLLFSNDTVTFLNQGRTSFSLRSCTYSCYIKTAHTKFF